jgi:asparagine synthase (glutamine-hydrolysing)
MSSLAAILMTDDAPVDAAVLDRLACASRAPGPHPRVSWISGSVGLAAAALHPDDCPYAEHDGVHVVFDGRLDDRASLGAAVGAHAGVAGADSDAALVARAYRTWNGACAERLHGDFALCLWDTRTRLLWAARDRFGVKPLCHTVVPGAVLVASGLAALRRHPDVSSRLADEAVGDFLLFGLPQNAAATCFAGVARLPPAHTLGCRPGRAPEVRRYWHLALPKPLRYRDPRQYVEHYRDTLATAVRERSRRQEVAIFMSGGLDSSTVAALAADCASPGRCLAVTAVYDRLIPDRERHYSSIVARSLGIAIDHVPVDDYGLFDRWELDARPVEPSSEPLSAISLDLLALAGRQGRVALTGDGGDPVLLPGAVLHDVGRVPARWLCRDLWWTARRGVRPPLGVKSTVLHRLARRPAMPPWLAPRLVAHYDAERRWRVHLDASRPGRPARMEAFESVSLPVWPSAFESGDPAVTGVPVELSYPFFDERVVMLSLALPSFPWCVQKTIVRDTMASRLPREILERPKTPLAGDALAARAWPLGRLLKTVDGADGLDAFVDVRAFRRVVAGSGDSWTSRDGVLETLCLAAWLRTEVGKAPVA